MARSRSRSNRGRAYSNDSRVSQSALEHMQRQINNLRASHKKQNHNKQNHKGPAKQRPAYKGKKPYETKTQAKQIGFAMVQMPTPTLDKTNIEKMHQAYKLYHTPDVTYTWPAKRGVLTAFQSDRSDGNAPMTIVASKLVEEDGMELYVDKSSGTAQVSHVPYKSWKYDNINNTFLLYVSGTMGQTDDLFKKNIEDATEKFSASTYYLFYSMALYSDSKYNKKRKNTIFISILVPCETLTGKSDTKIIEPQKLGIVKAKAFTNINGAVANRTSLLSKYKDFIIGTNYDSDCKLTQEQLKAIDVKFKSILEGTYLVKRITQSLGPVQVIQSEAIKFGNRFGIQQPTDENRMIIQMVCPMPGTSPYAKTVIRDVVKQVFENIKTKMRDQSYREAVIKKYQVEGATETWNDNVARRYLKTLLSTCNLAFFYRIMHYKLSSGRISQLKNVMGTWGLYFENAKCLPGKDDISKIREQPTDEIPLRRKWPQHPDESTDEEDNVRGADENDGSDMDDDEKENEPEDL